MSKTEVSEVISSDSKYDWLPMNLCFWNCHLNDPTCVKTKPNTFGFKMQKSEYNTPYMIKLNRQSFRFEDIINSNQST